MAAGDGNGWVRCRCGHRHWGRFGAAGLAVLRSGGDPGRATVRAGGPTTGTTAARADPPPAGAELLLQLRSAWTHQGGTWALPGGAADSHEDRATAALREAREEAGLEPGALRLLDEVVLTDHGDWTYTTVVALAGPDLEAAVANAESDEVRWVALEEVASLPLHPAFSLGWGRLEPALRRALDGALGGASGPGRAPGPGPAGPARAPGGS